MNTSRVRVACSWVAIRRYEVRFRYGELPRDRLSELARAQQELLRVLAGQRAERTPGCCGRSRCRRSDHVQGNE